MTRAQWVIVPSMDINYHKKEGGDFHVGKGNHGLFCLVGYKGFKSKFIEYSGA